MKKISIIHNDHDEDDLIAKIKQLLTNRAEEGMVQQFRVEKTKEDDRLEVRKKVQEAAKEIYNSLETCKPLQYLAGEIVSANEDYVIKHSGADETYGTVEILKTGFTTNQKKWLAELKELIDSSKH